MFLISLLIVIKPVSAANCGIVINEINTGDFYDWVELYNYGPPQDISNWQFYWQDERGDSGWYTIPSGFVLGHHKFVILHEESGTNTATDLYFDSNIMWLGGGSGGIAGALFDSSGKCIDYFRAQGSTDVPPAGSWGSPDMPYPITNDVGYRNSDTDTDTGNDWSVGGSSTPLALNPGQSGICIPEITVNPIAAFMPVKNYHLAQVNAYLACIEDNLPEDVPDDIQDLLDELQEHIDNANTTGNTIYANNELLRALDTCDEIAGLLDITCNL